MFIMWSHQPQHFIEVVTAAVLFWRDCSALEPRGDAVIHTLILKEGTI